VVAGAVLAGLLILPCWAGVAQAQDLRVELRAQVSEDLGSITGTLRWQGPEGVGFADALGTLPLPLDDRSALRTWPGLPEQGSLGWVEQHDERGRYLFFEAEVPDRYGAVGRVPGQGLFLNGGWYPVPVDADGRVFEAHWDVVADIPEGALGALGSDLGQGELRWWGQGERLGLAVIPGGQLQRIETSVGELRLVSRHGVSAARQRWLARSLEECWPASVPLELVVVDAPLMRRLARPAPGLLFLSSRALRVSPGLKHLHQLAVADGLLEAGLAGRLPEHRLRDFVAAVLAARAMERNPTAQGLLRWFAWLPQVDELLYAGNVPYVSEVMGEPWPGDSVADELLELLDPRLPGAVVAGRAALRGEPVVEVAEALLAGEPGPAWLRRQPRAKGEQDYQLGVSMEGTGARVTVVRDAPPDAPAEPLVVSVDGQPQLLELGEGSAQQSLELDQRPQRVVLDPGGLSRQEDRANDRWPTRWTTVVSAFPTVWNLSSGRVEGYLALRLRRQHDTRWLFDSYLFRDEVDLVGALGGVGYAWGPLQDRRWRPCRLYLRASWSLLDPAFRPTEAGAVALDASALFVWDTQVDWLFPLRGHRLVLGGGSGFVPRGGQRWASLSGRLAGVASPHPRLAFAGQARTGLAWGEVEHRLQVLGGVNNLRSLPAEVAVGHGKIVLRGEARAAPLRHVSVPLGFAWLDELQLAGGLEGGLLAGAQVQESYGATPPDGWIAAAGWTASSFVVIDVLGGQPALAGLLLAGPLGADPAWVRPPAPSLYLLWEQAL